MNRCWWAWKLIWTCATGLVLLSQASDPRLIAATSAPFSQSGHSNSDLQGVADNLVRESDDPNTGDRWLLLRDSAHPGSPGRWVLASRGSFTAGPHNADTAMGAPLTVIRPGDRLVVEQNSTLIWARLEAVALGSAVAGSVVMVRLQISGRMFKAVALGPGRAALEPDAGLEP